MLRSTIAGLLLTLIFVTNALAGGAPSETIVLINESSADSRRVGEHYIAERQIPPTNVCRVSCTTELTVQRVDFVRDVVTPLRALLAQRVGLVDDSTLIDRARFVVLTQGMPIRADGPGGSVSTAEMIALLDTDVCGQDGARMPRIRNPYTGGVAPGKSADGTQMFLVTALISSTAEEAIALIDRSVASDGTAPAKAHWVYQDASGAAGVRNAQYDAARTELETSGHTTEHVGRGKDVVIDRKRVMGYMSGGSYSGLSPAGVAQNEYLPGAICDMLQSFGSVPQNFGPDGKGGKQFPVTHMVRAGITGVQGTVAEPYNIAFPPADLFTPYSQGFTLAETFHQKIPFRYWMNLVLGDPLCAPYAARHTFDVGIAETRGITGNMIGVTARGAVRIEAFIDGISLGAVDVDDAPYALPTELFSDGPHRLLVEVTGQGASEPKAWQSFDLNFVHTKSVPRALPSQLALGTPLVVPLTRAPDAHAVTLSCEGEQVTHRATITADRLSIDIDRARLATLTGKTVDAEITLDDTPHAWQFRVGPARLRVEAEERVTAGDALQVRVLAVDAADAPLAGWHGAIELHGSKPPVRWAKAALGADGSATLRFVSPRAANVGLEVRAAGVAPASLSVVVEPGPPHHATTPVSRVPIGQVTDLPIRFEDKFGNTVSVEPGSLDVAFPDDPHARGAGAVQMSGGRGVLRDVVLTRPGRQRVVISEGRRTWSQSGEGVEGKSDFVRAWLATRAFRGDEAAALFEGDPSAGLHADGGAPGDRLFRRLRDGDATVDMPATASKDGDVSVAVAFVQALDDTEATLRIAAAARVRVLLDGDEVFDGVPGQTDPRKAPADAAELTLSTGMHRLTVIVERKGRFGFRLALAQGKQPLAPTLRVLADSDESPDRLCVSGRVLRAGGRHVAGAKVEVSSDGSEPRHALSAADGSWVVAGVADGNATVRLVEGPGLDAPIERTVEVDGAHVTDVDLQITDRTPPSVSIAHEGTLRAGRTLRLVADIRDDGGIARAWLEVDGEPLRGEVSRSPWTFTCDVADRPRGGLRVVVVAVDAAGNEQRSEPVAVELVDDDAGPTVSLRGLSRNGTLRKSTKVTATVRDPIGVLTVTFLVDDVEQAKAPAAGPYEVALDPSTLEPGRHELVCVARDTDGNETRKTLPFRVKR